MLDNQAQVIVDELVPLIRQFAKSEYGIAVGGAHAKGTADIESDLDIYLFASNVLNNAERTQLTTGFSSDIKELIVWGNDDPFDQGGTDFYFKGTKIECWLRNSDDINAALAECRQGVVRRDLITWTTTGFYNHCCLSDLKSMLPVEDPNGILADWKKYLSEYPPKLRESIINNHLSAAGFWPFNFHYTSAVKRQDIIYTTGIIQQVVHNLIQVLFAVNRVYFPGDKKLANALHRLEYLPDRFVERIESLVLPGEKAAPDLFEKQQLELQQLYNDVKSIVERYGQ